MTWRMKIFRLRTIAVGVMALLIVLVMGCGTSSPPPDPASSPMPLTPVDPDSPTVAIGDRPTAAIRPTKARLAPSTELQPTKTRLAPSVSNSEMADLVGGNNAFAFDLYRALSEQDGNLFYSPYSISMAVAMAYAGARGETEQQIADTLHYRLPQDRLHSSFNALDLDLASRGGEPKGQDQEGFQIFIANAVWGQEGYGFLDSFLDLLDENYGGDLRQVDFLQAPNASRLKINDWVAERTEDRIKDLLPDGAIDSFTRLVLTNAIYFNAAWLQPFDPKKTQAGQFELIDGSTVRVPMMLKTLWSAYAKGEGYQAVDLVYEGGEISMTILLPDKGTFREFEDSLDSAMLGRIVRDLQVERVKLSIPKFGFESGFSLRDTLKGMGMPDAFGDAADFSGMDGRSCTAGDHPCLIVSDVFHKGFVEVDEAGMEAAAATGLVVRVFSEPPEPTPVTVDRPFIFLIRDKKTEAILFLGRIVNPEKT